MHYLVSTASDIDAFQAHPKIGVITQPRTGLGRGIRSGRPWGCDCDVFGPHGVELGRYLDLLDRLEPYTATSLFVTLPDVPGDGAATLDSWEEHLYIFVGRGFPLAYVLQDGCETWPFPEGCSAVFLGGTDPWREVHAAPLLARAARQGLYVHVGRVNSARRCRALAPLGADSVDGTWLAWRSEGLEKSLGTIGHWLDGAQPLLKLAG